MTDDLVKRLRAETDGAPVNPDGLEAADRIEQLTERMRSSERTLNEIVNGDLRLSEKTGTKVRYSPADDRLVKRVKRMEAALQEIANFSLHGDYSNAYEMPRVALRTLAGEVEEND